MYMSAMVNGQRFVISSNIYTVILAFALAAVIASAAFVAYKCSVDYNTLFNIVAP
jgi:hypothetical protein